MGIAIAAGAACHTNGVSWRSDLWHPTDFQVSHIEDGVHAAMVGASFIKSASAWCTVAFLCVVFYAMPIIAGCGGQTDIRASFQTPVMQTKHSRPAVVNCKECGRVTERSLREQACCTTDVRCWKTG